MTKTPELHDDTLKGSALTGSPLNLRLDPDGSLSRAAAKRERKAVSPRPKSTEKKTWINQQPSVGEPKITIIGGGASSINGTDMETRIDFSGRAEIEIRATDETEPLTRWRYTSIDFEGSLTLRHAPCETDDHPKGCIPGSRIYGVVDWGSAETSEMVNGNPYFGFRSTGRVACLSCAATASIETRGSRPLDEFSRPDYRADNSFETQLHVLLRGLYPDAETWRDHVDLALDRIVDIELTMACPDCGTTGPVHRGGCPGTGD